jgi:hypothetical protein
MTVDQHVNAINAERRKAKGGWWRYDHPDVKANGYATWCERIEVGGIVDSTPSDLTVAKFLERIRITLDFALPCELNESEEV